MSHIEKDQRHLEKIAEMMHLVVQYHEYCAVADLRSQRDVRGEWPEAKEGVGEKGDCWMLAVSSQREESG